jgi:acetylornithine deacetylase/succinyl-diaminopimelate desuccinylase-like protein
VLVAEGEEEIASPHFPQIMHRPEVMAALRRCLGIFMPSAEQELDGKVTMTLGAKGVVELELVSSWERWGRGPRHDIHSSNKARVDSPAWHLVEALATLVSPDGNEPAIEGFADKARPLSAAEKTMIAEAARRLDEGVAKKQLGVEHWVHDASWQEALELLMSRPTVNIEGLVGGYTGPGGKTILPHRAVAKLDLRLVPDMKATEALAALKASREARLWRHRSEHDGRVRPQQHCRGCGTHSRAERSVQARRHRSYCAAAQVPGPATCLPASRYVWLPATLVSAMEVAPTRQMSTT